MGPDLHTQFDQASTNGDSSVDISKEGEGEPEGGV